MSVEMSATERQAVQEAAQGAPRVRQWRRYQAIVLVAEGHSAPEVATVLGVARSSVYNWLAAGRRAGAAGLAEGRHPGMARRFDAAGEHWLDPTLASDPQRHG